MRLCTHVAALVVTLALPAVAVEEQQSESPREIDLEALREERQEVAERYPVRSRTADRITKALEALEEDLYAEARARLERISPSRLNPYELAVIQRLVAYAAFQQEDIDGAIAAYQEVVAAEALAIDEEASVRFNIAQLYASKESWEEVATNLEEWFLYVEDPNPVAYYLLAIAYYQVEDRERALPAARKAVELSEEPKEGWLQLLAALYLTDENFANATPVVEQLVASFPKKRYWVQLSLLYAALERYDQSLIVQQLAYAQGLLTEDPELRRLTRSYLYHDLPEPAAQVLSKALDEGRVDTEVESLEMLANSWIAAREYDLALEPLKRAAELSEGGDLYVRLSRVYIQREQWPDAARELERAMSKGDLQNPGAAKVLLGISLYSGGRANEARSWFNRALEHEATREEARTWLDHLARESRSHAGPGA